MAEKGSPLPECALVLRRISKGIYNGKRPPPIPWTAFRPNDWKSEEDPGDNDGLSVYDASLTSVETVSGPKTGDVAQLAVRDIRAVIAADGTKPLDVVADPQDGELGHALIPAINNVAYNDKNQKDRVKELAMALATQAAQLIFVDGAHVR